MSVESDWKTTADSSGFIESTIKQKQISQNIGPHVEPCPGPNSGIDGVLEYVQVIEVP
jgi:hypothetical protein